MGKGQLVFKGEKKSKKHKKRKRTKEENDDAATNDDSNAGKGPKIDGDNDHGGGPSQPTVSSKSTSAASASASAMPSIRKGSGKITTSGTVVTGHGTNFEKELGVGDAIMVIHQDNNNQEELRVVTMRLSNTSVNLSSGFSSSLKEPHDFSIIRKPRNEQQERHDQLKKQHEQTQELEKNAFDLYNSTSTLVYREKTETGSYRIKKETLSGGGGSGGGDGAAPSRGDLLYMRSKKSSDKYC